MLEVFTAKGLPSSPGEAVDKGRLTQVGHALDRLGSSIFRPIHWRHAGARSACLAPLQDWLPKELKLAAHYVKARVKLRESDGALAGVPWPRPRRIARCSAHGIEIAEVPTHLQREYSPPSRRGRRSLPHPRGDGQP